MKRRRRVYTAAELERITQSARDARVAKGLPPDPPENAEYEQLQAERRATKSPAQLEPVDFEAVEAVVALFDALSDAERKRPGRKR